MFCVYYLKNIHVRNLLHYIIVLLEDNSIHMLVFTDLELKELLDSGIQITLSILLGYFT